MVAAPPEPPAETRHDPSCAVHGSKAKSEYQFELTIVLPPSPIAAQGSAAATALALVLPASSRELVRDLKAVVIESPEGFWLGSFSLARADDESERRLGDWDEIGSAFEDGEAADNALPKAIKVVDADLDDSEARIHILRLRDVLLGTSPAFSGKHGHRRLAYDPAAYAVDAGCSQYTLLRGPLPSSSTAPSSPPTTEPSREPERAAPLAITYGGEEGEAQQDDDVLSALPPSPTQQKKRKNHGKSKSRARSLDSSLLNGNGHGFRAIEPAPTPEPQPEPPVAGPSNSRHSGPTHAPDPADPSSHVFESWSQEAVLADPFDVIVTPRLQSEPSLPPLVRSLALSPYHPPPQHLRLRGHHLYLSVVTLEGARLHITACSRGFYVDRTTDAGFNPAARHSGLYHSSLLALLAEESPALVRALQQRLEPIPFDAPDAFAAAMPTACLPAVPWLVPRPKVEADPLRPQLAYLATGQLQPDLLPPASREWNEEFVTIREMPRKSPQERLNRDRMLARLQTEFAQAAAKGVIAIVRGDILPINPTEPKPQHTFLHNNLLLVSAEDPQGQHAHLGGDEAVRVTTLKDLHGVRVLNGLDIEGVHSIATCVIDFMGERWVVQALLPGLLGPVKPDDPIVVDEATAAAKAKLSNGDTDASLDEAEKGIANGDEATAKKEDEKDRDQQRAETGFKIVYGSSDTEQPALGAFTAEPKVHEIAAKLASHLHFAQHRVKDHGSETTHDMWTPIEVKGILGNDGRLYFIDLYRFQAVDITWLEKDLNGPLIRLPSDVEANGDVPHVNGVNGVNGHSHSSSSSSDAGSEATVTSPSPPTYPHHYTLLRPQLLEKFREDELRRYISEQMSVNRFNGHPHEGEGQLEWQRIAREAQASKAKPNGSTDSDSTDVMDSVTAAGHSVFEMSSFELNFHPDAYIERKDGPKLGEFPEEEKTVKLVRAASVYLREFLLPDYVSDLGVIVTQPHDGMTLTKQMHDRGIPMRYLGYVALACEKPPRGLPERHAPSARVPMRHLKALVMNEMIFRGAKHVFRRLIRGAPAIEQAPMVSHFLNCLVGDLVEPYPHPDLAGLSSSTSRAWSDLSVSSLRDLITAEIALRFRFVMPRSFFSSPDFARAQLLRDFGLRCGIQLELQKYDLRPTSASRSTVFVADNVINLVPVIHDAPHKTPWVDEHFESGQNHFRMGQIAAGEAIINEALSFYEQVYGNIHPELARHYHELAILYHSVANPIMRNVNIFEHGHSLSSSVDERAKSKKESGFTEKEAMLEAKREAQGFFEQAVRMNKQSVIIAERCFGLDTAETLQHYIDLGILEHANEHSQLALYYCRHALAILALVSGPNHSDWSRVLLNAAQILQAWQGHRSSVDLFLICRDITSIARGTETHVTATIFNSVAAALANSSRFRESMDVQKAALAIFDARFGPDDDRTKEAEATLQQLAKLAVRKEKGEHDRVMRIMRRMRTDEGRAREIIARSKADANDIKGKGRAVEAGASAESKQPEVAPTPSFAHLDIDEIVAIIEGGGSASSSSNKRRTISAIG